MGLTWTPTGGAAERYAYAVDAQGSTSLLLGAGGAVRASYGYTPYGAPDAQLTQGDAGTGAEPVLNPYRYAGQRWDPLSGTQELGARRYWPDRLRSLQRDWATDAAGEVGLALDPLTMNRYAYAGSNPVGYREAGGHQAVPVSGPCGVTGPGLVGSCTPPALPSSTGQDCAALAEVLGSCRVAPLPDGIGSGGGCLEVADVLGSCAPESRDRGLTASACAEASETDWQMPGLAPRAHLLVTLVLVVVAVRFLVQAFTLSDAVW